MRLVRQFPFDRLAQEEGEDAQQEGGEEVQDEDGEAQVDDDGEAQDDGEICGSELQQSPNQFLRRGTLPGTY